ncbi:hypothetical protein SPHINGOT1_80148 [Sphingomonas sp. T1]|uniref:hypothetical protein n=1 Tax=Sphingomonas sp. T1 TaxID=2653172 RepID=UPI0012F41532|nr:hypothetical protein [Sphingomonas sp. T1]VXD07563.1 hypothetical protein SPHINGOT1_80148 [Sphingomonas sp. T1]
MMDPATFEAFNALANETSRDVGDRILTITEQAVSPLLNAQAVFVGALTGGLTGVMKVLHAAAQAGVITDVQDTFDLLIRQTVDTWGQMRGEGPAYSGKLQ